MIVELRTIKQAGEAAAATGGVHLPGKPRKDGTVPLSRLVDVGPGFEPHRAAVEALTVLFKLYDGDAASHAETGTPGRPLRTGWTIRGARFEVEWPSDPERAALVRSHFGARRFVFNWGLDRVKADLDARKADPAHEPVQWELASLRKAWNQAKNEDAAWWAANSKEAYACGLDDLAAALKNWKQSRDGERKGRRVGFPRFQSARRNPGRVRFTTGAMRLEPDRRTVTLPVIGALRSKENTRRVQRHLAERDGQPRRGQLLNITLSERWGRLFVSVCYAVRAAARQPAARPRGRARVDLGLRVLATVSSLDPVTGVEVITGYPNPAPLRQALAGRRQAGRELSRRIPGSRGHRAASAKLARMDRRAVHVRREAARQLTTELTGEYGEIVIEDLDLAAMKRGMGRRAFRRSVSDAALGQVRPQLAYKAGQGGTVLTVASRWFPSSQIQHGHVLPGGAPCRLEGMRSKLDKHLTCPVTGEIVDRDVNAARNLRDWPDMPVEAQLEPRPCTSAVPKVTPETAAQQVMLRSGRKTSPVSGVAVRGEARTDAATSTAAAKELRKECAT